MEPLNQNEWLRRFTMVNRVIVEALFQIYQNADTQTERANHDNENPLQRGVHSSEEMPNDVSHCELTNFQLQTESNQENISLNLYQTESDDDISFKLSPEKYFCDDEQSCAPDFNHPGYVCEVNTINNEQSDDLYIKQPCFSNIQNSKSTPVHIPNRNAEESNSCKICNQYFKYNSQLNRHMLKHSGEKLFECHLCEKRFIQKFDLNKHMLIHSGTKTFVCNVCEQSFTQKGNLNRHMLQHSGEKPFQCQLCEKRFTRKVTLDNHVLTHSGEKLYKCDICNKQFAHQSYVKTHMLIHSGEKPHSCPICNKAFTQKSHLTRHILTHEKKKCPKTKLN